MRKPLYYLTALMILLQVPGCEDDNGNNNGGTVIDGTGPIVTKNLDFSSFSRIRLTGVANFHIATGMPQTVVLKAQQNIIDVMTYGVADSTLEVGLQRNVSIGTHEEIRFDITLPSMTGIELEGVGDFNLNGDPQDVLDIYITGVGNIYAFPLEVGTCSIYLTGVGDCRVNATDVLNVTITGVGNVYYMGSPEIHSTVTGVGNLINAPG